jgi:hypothetical protein
MAARPGKVVTWGEMHVGALQVFEAVGFREVSHPTLRRHVVSFDVDDRGSPH